MLNSNESHAELFLKKWADEYENSQGEISEPDFSGIETNYSDIKNIPHYVFDDASVIMVIRDYFGKEKYLCFSCADELEEIMDLESDSLNNEYITINVVEGA